MSTPKDDTLPVFVEVLYIPNENTIWLKDGHNKKVSSGTVLYNPRTDENILVATKWSDTSSLTVTRCFGHNERPRRWRRRRKQTKVAKARRAKYREAWLRKRYNLVQGDVLLAIGRI